MEKVIQTIKTRYKLLSLGALCLVVGAASSFAVAHASIPAADGQIHGCRNTTTTMLRVVDDATQACDGNETGLNWSQKGVLAYTHLIPPGAPLSGNFSLDPNRSYNVSNIHTTNIQFNDFQICLTVAGNPKNVTIMNEGTNSITPRASVKDENGWTSTAAAVCDQVDSTTNVYIRSGGVTGASSFVTIF